MIPTIGYREVEKVFHLKERSTANSFNHKINAIYAENEIRVEGFHPRLYVTFKDESAFRRRSYTVFLMP